MKLTRTLAAAATVALGVALVPSTAQASTYWAAYPFFSDSIPVYDATGRTATMTAVNRWEHTGDGYNLWRTTSRTTAASRGVTIQWTTAYSGTGIGGVATWYYSGGTIKRCVIKVNTNIRGVGRPSGRMFEAIVSHEFGHCMGLKHDTKSSVNIMRPNYNPGSAYYRPTSLDKARARLALATN